MSASGRLSTSPAKFSRDHLLAWEASQGDGALRRHKRQRTLSNTSLPGIQEGSVDAGLSDEEEDEDRRTSRRIARRISSLQPSQAEHLDTTRVSARPSRSSVKQTVNETTPLIAHDSSDENLPLPEAGTSHYAFEGALITRYSLPILAATLCEYSLVVATTISTGHISTTALAAASLGSISINVTTLSMVQGLCTALDTLCSQAAGSDKPELAGLHAQRSCIVLASVMPFQIAFCWFSEAILLGIGQDPAVSRLACQYLRIMSFGIPAYGLFEVMRRWLQAQGMMLPPTISVAIFTPVNIFLQWYLVAGPAQLGFAGAPLATVISFNGICLFNAIYCYFRAPRRCWAGFDRRAFSNLGPNIRLGLSGCAAVMSEWLAFEMLGVGSSYLGPDRLGAQSVILSTASLTYQIPYSLSVGTSVRIGNLLGAGHATLAGKTLKIAIIMGTGIGLFNSLLMVLLRGHLPRIFTSDQTVIDLCAQVFRLVSLVQVFDALNGVCAGILRGAGRSPIAAIINAVGYYCIGLPLGFVLAFYGNLDLDGLWLGVAVALGVCCVPYIVYSLRLDLAREVEVAKQRMA